MSNTYKVKRNIATYARGKWVYIHEQEQEKTLSEQLVVELKSDGSSEIRKAIQKETSTGSYRR